MSNLVFMVGACIIAKCINQNMFSTDDLINACSLGFFIDVLSYMIWRK